AAPVDEKMPFDSVPAQMALVLSTTTESAGPLVVPLQPVPNATQLAPVSVSGPASVAANGVPSDLKANDETVVAPAVNSVVFGPVHAPDGVVVEKMPIPETNAYELVPFDPTAVTLASVMPVLT